MTKTKIFERLMLGALLGIVLNTANIHVDQWQWWAIFLIIGFAGVIGECRS
jgi:hypothetical protein